MATSTPTSTPQGPGILRPESGFVQVVTGRLANFFKSLQPGSDRTTEAPPNMRVGLGFNSYFQTWHDLYSDLIGEVASRAEKYAQYVYLDKNLAEASASLNVYADNVVSGTIGGEESYNVVIDEETANWKKLEEIVDEAEKNSNIKEHVWDICRNLTKSGDEFVEVVVTDVGGKLVITKLKSLPPKTVEANVDDRGVVKDPAFPYYQKPEIAGGGAMVPLDWWRIIHFKIGNAVYGVDYSLFANASLRIGRQLIWVDECMVLARMSRAWQRFAYMIDTGKLGPDDALDFVTKFMNKLKQKRIVSERQTGQTSIIDAPLLPDEDVGIPVGENSKADVKPLVGDMNVGRIEDVKYLQNKFLMACTMPKAYVSLEEGVNAKATIGQLDVQFARQVRRRQQALVPGLKKFYELVFVLAGVDPKSFKWSIEFPELATTDESIKWDMLLVKAQAAQILAGNLGAVNNLYILKELLGMDQDEIDQYAADYSQEPESMPAEEPDVAPAPGTGGEPVATNGPMGKTPPPKGAPPAGKGRQVQLPPQTAAMIRRDPQVRRILDDLKDLINYKISREKALYGMKPIGLPVKSSRLEPRPIPKAPEELED